MLPHGWKSSVPLISRARTWTSDNKFLCIFSRIMTSIGSGFSCSISLQMKLHSSCIYEAECVTIYENMLRKRFNVWRYKLFFILSETLSPAIVIVTMTYCHHFKINLSHTLAVGIKLRFELEKIAFNIMWNTTTSKHEEWNDIGKQFHPWQVRLPQGIEWTLSLPKATSVAHCSVTTSKSRQQNGTIRKLLWS